MRILIAYDASECAKFAVAELSRAGLAEEVEARVITAVESWPVLPAEDYVRAGRPEAAEVGPTGHRIHELAIEAAAEAGRTVQDGVLRLRSAFPGWKVESEVGTEPPAESIVALAESWKADLVVMGSQGHTALGRFFLGGVSHKVVRYAPCSVRVARQRTPHGEAGLRLAVGFDGSAETIDVVKHVAARRWPMGTSVALVCALDLRLASSLPKHRDPREVLLERMADSGAMEMLQHNGLTVSPLVKEGDAKHVLVKEAESWGADCLFVGARGVTGAKRFLVGSVSAAIVSRAPCTVEVVRQRH